MAIKKINLTVAELLQLDMELSSEKGLLTEALPMVFKYHLSKVAKIANEEQMAVGKIRDEAIKALGTETEGGGYSIPQYVEVVNNKKKSNVINPSYIKFTEDMESLFSQEKEIEFEEFVLSDLKNVESGMNFPVFFKLIDA